MAALHFMENALRGQATTIDGRKRYDIIFPKFKKGDYSVREVKVDCTYGMYMHFFGVYLFLNEKNSLQMHLLRG